MKRYWAALAILALLSGACGPSATPTSQPAPTASPKPTTVRAAPTAVSAAPTATAAPLARTATPTSQPTTAPARAAQTKPKYGGVLRFPVKVEPRGADPWKFFYSDVLISLGLVHDRLTRYGDVPCSIFPLRPQLANSWSWVDDTTLEFKLKQGVKYPAAAPVRGREFVADDVVFSAKKQWPKVGIMGPSVQLFQDVLAKDKYTVRFQLKQPVATIWEMLDNQGTAFVAAPEIFGPDNDVAKYTDNVGLGPFAIKRYLPGVAIELEKNPNFTTVQPGLPYLDGIRLIVIPDVATQLAGLASGKFDALFIDNSASILEAERLMPQLEVGECSKTAGILTALAMNLKQRPFDNVLVRRAVSMAVDREGILRTVAFGKGEIIYTGVHRGFGDYYLPPEKYPAEVRKLLEYRPEDAKKLLAEAGYPNGFSTSIAYTARFVVQPRFAEAVSASLEKIGIKVTLQPLEYVRFQEVVYGGKFEQMAVFYTGTGGDLITSLWDTYHSTSTQRNRGHFSDPKMDRMLEELRVTKDDARRIKLAHDLQVLQVQDGNLVYFPADNEALFAYPYVKNMSVVRIDRAWADDIYMAWLDR